jgi:hypothetical protein
MPCLFIIFEFLDIRQQPIIPQKQYKMPDYHERQVNSSFFILRK